MTLAPCGVVCELCIGFQRIKNKCVGCLSSGNKPKHCTVCSIKNCPEKDSEEDLCINCDKFPCRRLRDLEKRYSTRYGESPTENMRTAQEQGREAFSEIIRNTWTCSHCGTLLSAHRETCIVCGSDNINYPIESDSVR